MVRHVFFDFFGTLVDYDPSTHPAYNAPLAFARRAGSAISPEAVNEHWQNTWDALESEAGRTGCEYSMHQVAQRYWAAIGSPPVSGDAIDTLIEEYLDAWTGNVRPAAAALDCVTDLAVDHRLTIVSNSHAPALVPRLVHRFGLNVAVDMIITSVEVGWRKPHPKIFEAALHARGTTAADVVFVGDNWAADVEGPRRLGMSSIYVGGPEPARASTALTELPRIIRSLPAPP